MLGTVMISVGCLRNTVCSRGRHTKAVIAPWLAIWGWPGGIVIEIKI